LEYRSVIKFLTKEGHQPKTIRERMVPVYGNDAPPYYTIKFWSKRFRWGRESIDDDPRSGRPKTATNEDMTQKVEAMVLEDGRVKVSTISTALDISEPSVISILHDNLNMIGDDSDFFALMCTTGIVRQNQS
jgi:transposase